jgi:hypothetical protein
MPRLLMIQFSLKSARRPCCSLFCYTYGVWVVVRRVKSGVGRSKYVINV